MKIFVHFVACVWCLSTGQSSEIYKAAITNTFNRDFHLDQYASLVSEASKLNVDVLVLPSPEITDIKLSSQADCGVQSYDEAIRIISNAAKHGGLYVVAHLFEKIRCQNNNELIRSNLVFDRKGAIISVSRKPLNTASTCNTTTTEFSAFATDFGVTFDVLMEEDLALQNLENLKGVKNFVVSGKISSEIPFLKAAQLSAPWAYVNDVNLISPAGIFAGKSGVVGTGSKIVVADLSRDGRSGYFNKYPVITSTNRLLAEDLNEYIIRPLNIEASKGGYKEYLCHDKFCCEFYVKANFEGVNLSKVNHYLAVYNGVRHFSGMRRIGVQSCVVFACAGDNKRTCVFGSENNTNNVFHDISISGNFTKENAAQYPIILTNGIKSITHFKFEKIDIKTSQQVTIRSAHSDVLSFGIFGRDYSKDTESSVSRDANSEGLTSDMYDYLYNEDVLEFFDYVWIRLRILIFVVSIYILEMM